MTEDLAALRAGRDAAGRADLVELRLDGLRHPDVAGALAGRRAPVIATCRPVWEGGRFEGSESDRLGILKQALELGAEYVDVEWNARVMRELLGETTRHRVVLSVHDFTGMPADVARLAAEMGRLAPGVVKIAVTPTGLRDLVALAGIGRGATSPTVLIAMGPVGLPTRVAPAHFGSCWTYAGNGVAPGQVPTNRLIDEFRVPAVDPSTPVYAVVGRPISHSVSPAMHNAAFASLGMPGVYIPCQAESLDDFVALADALPIVGVSVTAPFKEAAAILTNAEARGESALNTLRRLPGGEWEGLNTDVDGFLAPLDGIELAGRRAAVVGAGGAARSVTEGLRRKQAPDYGSRPSSRCGGGLRARARARRWWMAGSRGVVGSAREHDAGGDATGRRGDAARGLRSGRATRLRPGLQPAADTPAARGGRGRLPDDRRARDAGAAGRSAVRVVDWRDAVRRRHACSGRAAAGRNGK